MLAQMRENKASRYKKHIDESIAAGRGAGGGGQFAKAGSERSLYYGEREQGLSRLPVPTCAGIPDIARPPRYPTRRRRRHAGSVSAGLSALFSSSSAPAPPPFCALQW